MDKGEPVRKDVYLWRCMYCGLGFSSKRTALVHVKQEHTKESA